MRSFSFLFRISCLQMVSSTIHFSRSKHLVVECFCISSSASQHYDCVFHIAAGNATETKDTNISIISYPKILADNLYLSTPTNGS